MYVTLLLYFNLPYSMPLMGYMHISPSRKTEKHTQSYEDERDFKENLHPLISRLLHIKRARLSSLGRQ